MNWDLEGLSVKGNYMGDPSFPVSGRVCLSRVKYGGGISHHVILDTPIMVYGAERDRVILENEFVNQIYSN